jgi:hypothetical protein
VLVIKAIPNDEDDGFRRGESSFGKGNRKQSDQQGRGVE